MRNRLMEDTSPLKPRGPQCFVDWRYVEGGEVSWREDGEPLDQWAGQPGKNTFGYPSGPSGIRLQAQKAEVVGPLFPMDKPWESQYNMYFSTAVYEDGLYRAWYTCVPPDHLTRKGLRWRKAAGQVVCYAESDDGFNWRKPSLGLWSYNGEDTNVVFGRDLSLYGFQSGSIFKDPTAPAEERYRLFYVGEIDTDNLEETRARYAERWGDEMDPGAFVKKGDVGGTVKALCAAVSPDGIHWKAIVEPLMILASDTLNTVSWNKDLGRYVAYLRLRRRGRRVVARAESPDFFHWPELPDVCLEPPLHWTPSDDIYTNAKTLYPGSNDTHLMFPGVFHHYEDSRDIYLAASLDGYSWQWVPGGDPVVQRGPLGAWYGGDLNPGVGLVPLAGDRIALPILGYYGPHKYPRGGEKTLGELGWAVWARGRLSAIVADRSGEFSTPKLQFEGRELVLNLQTERAGEVLVELRDDKRNPIPGFTFAEADPIMANSLDRRVSWGGNADIGEYAGKTIILAFRLRSAQLFAFEFVS